ncbi:uncharacterized protein LOC133137908 [Conger conger]|uniref:uncharacterized protein LOC133137908 n=1 Tax=Conger conger TaxID=82655 RepID=UPI002A5AFD9B|nr:uncharacterized protein LOC133137908 [Conger conger]
MFWLHICWRADLETMLVCVWLVSSLIHTISGCSLSAPGGVTGYTGGSVVLSCSCTDGGTIPGSARWHFQPGPSGIALWSGGRVDDRYKDRALISDSPGNMSLRLSALTLSDGGLYRCEADSVQFEDITLTVKESGQEEATEDQKNTLFVAIAVVAVVTLFTVCGAVFYCRVRGRRSTRVESRGPNEKRAKEQEEDPDSVTYSTVIHREKDKNTKSQNQTPVEDSTEYATIKCHT